MKKTDHASFSSPGAVPFVNKGILFDSKLLRNGDMIVVRQLTEDSIAISRHTSDTLVEVWKHIFAGGKEEILLNILYVDESQSRATFFMSWVSEDDAIENSGLQFDLATGVVAEKLRSSIKPRKADDATPVAVTEAADSSYIFTFYYKLHSHPESKVWMHYSVFGEKTTLQDSIELMKSDDLEESLHQISAILPGANRKLYVVTRQESGATTAHQYDLMTKAHRQLELADNLVKRRSTPEREYDIALKGGKLLRADGSRILFLAHRSGTDDGNALVALLDFETSSSTATAFDLIEGAAAFKLQRILRYPDRWILMLERIAETLGSSSSGTNTIIKGISNEPGGVSTYKTTHLQVTRPLQWSSDIIAVGLQNDLKPAFQQFLEKDGWAMGRDWYTSGYERSHMIRQDVGELNLFYRQLKKGVDGLWRIQIDPMTGAVKASNEILDLPYNTVFMMSHLHWLDSKTARMFVWDEEDPKTAKGYTLKLH